MKIMTPQSTLWFPNSLQPNLYSPTCEIKEVGWRDNYGYLVKLPSFFVSLDQGKENLWYKQISKSYLLSKISKLALSDSLNFSALGSKKRGPSLFLSPLFGFISLSLVFSFFPIQFLSATHYFSSFVSFAFLLLCYGCFLL